MPAKYKIGRAVPFGGTTRIPVGLVTLAGDLEIPQEEEADDAYTGHLRFNINFLAGRLAARWFQKYLRGRA